MESISHVPPADDEKFLYIPYEERWERLKPVIASLYLGNDESDTPMTIPQLAKHMRDYYSFPAE